MKFQFDVLKIFRVEVEKVQKHINYRNYFIKPRPRISASPGTALQGGLGGYSPPTFLLGMVQSKGHYLKFLYTKKLYIPISLLRLQSLKIILCECYFPFVYVPHDLQSC